LELGNDEFTASIGLGWQVKNPPHCFLFSYCHAIEPTGSRRISSWRLPEDHCRPGYGSGRGRRPVAGCQDGARSSFRPERTVGWVSRS
jgi:hypothetical protein